MNSQRWQRVQELFAEAADLSPAERETLLDARCAGDPDLRSEVDSLFEYDSEDITPLDLAVKEVAASLVGAETMLGRRIGAYRLTRCLGTGGMGTVYLGVRDDAQFEQKVAIKLVRSGLNTRAVQDRFRYERRILAQLDHPYVSKLFDGGTTEDGLPYFVMEYVEGTPIHRYCVKEAFTVAQKCELFAKVCEAVSYAHRNLVVHRDLKPSNIMVTEDGTPKLLDFGIAKLLTPDLAESSTTRTGQAPIAMTPDYASPEQVSGAAVNTSTDVYSLGAVLYELLSGARPHRLSSLTPLALERAICIEEVRRPSSTVTGPVRRQLAGDLDNIVLMAMRKEPQRRYQSAAEFREDIQRHLKGLPVAAREDTLWYRTGKFVRRNQVGVFAASLVFLALTGGVIATDHERHVAEAQRENADRERARAQAAQADAAAQRDAALRSEQNAVAQSKEAELQKQYSEERLGAILEIADKSLVSIEESVATLPGAVEVRKKIVDETLGYLDKLAAHSGSDARVRKALLNGYLAMGSVQGFPYRPNLGDYRGAKQTLGKAAVILDSLLKEHPDDVHVLMDAVQLYQASGEISGEMAKGTEAKAILLKGLAAAERLTKVAPGKRSTIQVALMHHSLAMLLISTDPTEGTAHALQEQKLYGELAEQDPKDLEVLNALGSSYLLLAQSKTYEGKLTESMDYLKNAAKIREDITTQFPNDVRYARNLLVTYGRIGDASGGPYLSRNLGDSAQAVLYYRKALAIAERLEKADPKDRLAKTDVAAASMRLGMALEKPGELEESIASLLRSEAILKSLEAADPTSSRERRQLITVYEALGQRMEAQHKPVDALNHYRTSVELSEALLSRDPQMATAHAQIYADYRALSLLMVAMGRRADALQYVEKLIARAELIAGLKPATSVLLRFPARSYEAAGAVYEKLARGGGTPEDWSNARRWFERSRDAWVKLGESPEQRPVDGEVTRLNSKLAECDRQLMAVR